MEESFILQINNEYDRLKKVLMASVETFVLHKPINKTQKYYYENDPPIIEKLIIQQEAFVEVLKKHNVDIVWAPKRFDCTNQINTRDVAFVIGNTFVISPMKKAERQNEHLALEEIVGSFDKTDTVFRPHFGIIEGGDIILDNGRIFVGISERTNWAGYDWLVNNYSKGYEIIPIELNDTFLHLDVVFNLLSGGYALIYKEGIRIESLERISHLFNIIEVDSKEQDNLATNVFALSPDVLVCDNRNIRTNAKLKYIGKKIIELNFGEITKIGGSFRCGTCPLVRE